MKNAQLFSLLLITGLFFANPRPATPLSESIGRDFHFPKNYDPKKAETLRQFVRQEKYKFVGGNVSHWVPDFGTRLSFEGDTASFNQFLSELRGLKDFSLRLVMYQGKNEERRRDSSWQLDFSHAHPNRVTVYLNLKSPHLDFYKIQLPLWE